MAFALLELCAIIGIWVDKRKFGKKISPVTPRITRLAKMPRFFLLSENEQ
jgi:hypothetical protein